MVTFKYDMHTDSSFRVCHQCSEDCTSCPYGRNTETLEAVDLLNTKIEYCEKCFKYYQNLQDELGQQLVSGGLPSKDVKRISNDIVKAGKKEKEFRRDYDRYNSKIERYKLTHQKELDYKMRHPDAANRKKKRKQILSYAVAIAIVLIIVFEAGIALSYPSSSTSTPNSPQQTDDFSRRAAEIEAYWKSNPPTPVPTRAPVMRVTPSATPVILATPAPTPVPTPEATPKPANPVLSDYSFEKHYTFDSSCFSQVGYDAGMEALFVTFRDSGKSYIYTNFSQYDWNSFSSASSLGSYYNSYIKGKYTCLLISGDKLTPTY